MAERVEGLRVPAEDHPVLQALIEGSWHSWDLRWDLTYTWAQWDSFGDHGHIVIHEMRERAGEWTW